jgi:hypothetical protein
MLSLRNIIIMFQKKEIPCSRLLVVLCAPLLYRVGNTRAKREKERVVCRRLYFGRSRASLDSLSILGHASFNSFVCRKCFSFFLKEKEENLPLYHLFFSLHTYRDLFDITEPDSGLPHLPAHARLRCPTDASAAPTASTASRSSVDLDVTVYILFFLLFVFHWLACQLKTTTHTQTLYTSLLQKEFQRSKSSKTTSFDFDNSSYLPLSTTPNPPHSLPDLRA